MDAEFPNFFEKGELCDECGRDSKTYVNTRSMSVPTSIDDEDPHDEDIL